MPTPAECAAGDATFRRLYCGEDAIRPNVNTFNGSPPDYANSPSGPNATVFQTYAEAIGQTEVTDGVRMPDSGTPAPGGCCAPGEAKCWKCWVRDHWQWVLIIALGILAYLTRKK